MAAAKETFSRWDAADYLRSEADMAAYLEAALDEAPDDAELFIAALGDIARARAGGMMKLSRDTGLTREGLYKALSPHGNPSLGTVLKVVHALRLKLTPQPAPDKEPVARAVAPRAVPARATVRPAVARTVARPATAKKSRKRETCPA